jgi:hypothetical protein
MSAAQRTWGDLRGGRVVVGTHRPSGATLPAGSLRLHPFEAIVVRLE